MTTDTDLGPTHSKLGHTTYFSPDWDFLHQKLFYRPSAGAGAQFDVMFRHPAAMYYELLAAVDPVQEAKLVGLDKAVLKQGDSRYFDKTESVEVYNGFVTDMNGNKIRNRDVVAPILASKQSFVNTSYSFTIQKLDIPVKTDGDKAKLTSILQGKNGAAYLDHAKPAGSAKTYTYPAESTYANGMKELKKIDPEPGNGVEAEGKLKASL